MKHLGILASGRGSNMKAIIDACDEGRLDARTTVVISNNSKAPALDLADQANIETHHLSSKTHPEPDDLDNAICDALTTNNVDWVITAGYMKKLGPKTLATFKDRIVNVHPALLPKHGGKGMYGMNVHQAVLDAGETETGVTVHFVDADYDTGPTIAQRTVPVEPGDTAETLAQRVLAVEHEFFVETLSRLVSLEHPGESH